MVASIVVFLYVGVDVITTIFVDVSAFFLIDHTRGGRNVPLAFGSLQSIAAPAAADDAAA